MIAAQPVIDPSRLIDQAQGFFHLASRLLSGEHCDWMEKTIVVKGAFVGL
jgi:hypothetical protein